MAARNGRSVRVTIPGHLRDWANLHRLHGRIFMLPVRELFRRPRATTGPHGFRRIVAPAIIGGHRQFPTLRSPATVRGPALVLNRPRPEPIILFTGQALSGPAFRTARHRAISTYPIEPKDVPGFRSFGVTRRPIWPPPLNDALSRRLLATHRPHPEQLCQPLALLCASVECGPFWLIFPTSRRQGTCTVTHRSARHRHRRSLA